MRYARGHRIDRQHSHEALACPDDGATELRRDATAGDVERGGLAAEHLAGTGKEILRRRAFVASLGRTEFLEQLLLLRAHPRRSLDENARDEIAAAAAVEN